MRWPVAGRRRCKFHGGNSIHNHRPGLSASALRAVASKQALYKAVGLPWHGGAPRKVERVRTMVERAVVVAERAIAELEAAVPVDVRTLPVEDLTPPQALGLGSLLGLQQLVRIVRQPLDLDSLKQQRLIGDMALGMNKLLQRHAEGERSHDLIGKLLAAIEAEKTEK